MGISNRARWLLRRIAVHNRKFIKTLYRWRPGSGEEIREDITYYSKTAVCRLCKKKSKYPSVICHHLRRDHGLVVTEDHEFLVFNWLTTSQEKFDANSLGQRQ